MVVIEYTEAELVDQRSIVDSTLKFALKRNNIDRNSTVSERTMLLTQEEMQALHLISHRDKDMILEAMHHILKMFGIVGKEKLLHHPERRAELWLIPKEP